VSRIVCLALICCVPCAAEARPLVYVTNSLSNTVSVIDVGRGQLVKEIPVGKEPFGLAFSPDGQRAYVANAQSREVSVIEVSQHRLLRNILVNSELPVWVAVSPDGSYVYVTNERSNDVTVIAAASNAVVGRIPVGRGPAGIVVCHDSRYAYVANEGSHDVSLLDLQREGVIKTIAVGRVPQGLAASPDGAWLYAANFGSNSISVIATPRNEVEAQILVGSGPVSVAVSPDGYHVYTGNFTSGSLSVVDALKRTEVASVHTGSETFGVASDPGGKHVYAVNGKDGQLSVVDTGQLEVTQRIALGKGPFKLAVVPEFPFRLQQRHFWIGLFLVTLGTVLFQATKFVASAEGSTRLLMGAFVLALGLRVVGLNWGVPVFQAETARATPELRVSFHLDEDNLLWNLTRVRPESLDFYVPDFHWGTLQYHLVEMALLLAESVGLISSPWRESFLSFHPIEYARVFGAGRAVSAILGACSVFLAYAIGSRLYGRGPAIVSALILSLLPVHVVNSHYLTSDVTMVFFLLLAFLALVSSFENPSKGAHALAGLAAGLAVTAKYNAVYLLPVAFLWHVASRMGGWRKKIWFYPGIALGFLMGEPYALVYRRQFWESVEPYLLKGALPEGAGPGSGALLSLQAKNMAFFGLGLPLTLALLFVLIPWLVGYASKSLPNVRTCSVKENVARYLQAPKNQLRLVLALTVVSFVLSMVLLRQPLLRYTLPVTVFLIFPTANFLSGESVKPWRRGLVIAALFLTGVLSLLQVRILVEEHTVNQAFQWIERHVPAGASIKKGWPEIPVLNPRKFRVTNFFVQKRLADFRGYFADEAGKAEFPDYVLLDSLPTLEIPPEFFTTLQENYCLVAEFERVPQLGRFKLPEWEPPHDWRYSHPLVRIYRRRT
jgi:YVTN family beta-propeller protein